MLFLFYNIVFTNMYLLFFVDINYSFFFFKISFYSLFL